jgi:hypothetical protein
MPIQKQIQLASFILLILFFNIGINNICQKNNFTSSLSDNIASSSLNSDNQVPYGYTIIGSSS